MRLVEQNVESSMRLLWRIASLFVAAIATAMSLVGCSKSEHGQASASNTQTVFRANRSHALTQA
jgi:hypothetical protein